MATHASPTTITGRLDWKAAIRAGLISGTVFMMIEMLRTPFVSTT